MIQYRNKMENEIERKERKNRKVDLGVIQTWCHQGKERRGCQKR